MADSPTDAKPQGERSISDADRLKQDYASRMAGDRPVSHSVAVAYRQLIARCEQQANKSPE